MEPYRVIASSILQRSILHVPLPMVKMSYLLLLYAASLFVSLSSGLKKLTCHHNCSLFIRCQSLHGDAATHVAAPTECLYPDWGLLPLCSPKQPAILPDRVENEHAASPACLPGTALVSRQ